MMDGVYVTDGLYARQRLMDVDDDRGGDYEVIDLPDDDRRSR